MKIKINFLDIKKKLPEWFKKPLRGFYYRITMKIDKEIISFLKEYFNINEKKVIFLLRYSGQMSTCFWYCQNPKTEEEIKRFYTENPFYLFNLIFWHAGKEQRRLREEMSGLAKGKVLDYGAGTGDLCFSAKRKNMEIDYADLPGKTFDFAKWTFEKKGINIPMIDLSKEKIQKNYDTIFLIDVIEHVLDPKELLKDLTNHLNKKGQLMITALNPDVNEMIPMHFKLNFDPEKYLSELGMVKTQKPFLWIKE